MRISFDLDDTLIPSSKGFPLEPKPILSKIMKHEDLRLGTKELIKALQSFGHEILIYTTSYRSNFYIKSMFAFYRIRNLEVINQTENLKRQKQTAKQYSKNPMLFQIDLHIDDLEGVAIEARQNKSTVLIIEDSNKLHVSNLLELINDLSK